jgi:hypothetical protein
MYNAYIQRTLLFLASLNAVHNFVSVRQNHIQHAELKREFAKINEKLSQSEKD